MKKEEVIEIVEKLKKYYPEAKCSLDFKTPFELAIAVMLSAQCTDERVNKTTPHLFEKYCEPQAICDMELEKLEKIIYPCGFYKNKAKNIKAMAKEILEKYNGKVPETMEELTSLPGIGRKSANVIMLEAYNNPQGIAIDTHAKRILTRLEITKNLDPSKIEKDILKILPKEYYKDVNHLLVHHGRAICSSKKPKCGSCPIRKNCRGILGTEEKIPLTKKYSSE